MQRISGRSMLPSACRSLDSQLRTPHSALRHCSIPLAQVHDSFIVAQSQDGMALIDQHAAHERVLFEKLQDQSCSGQSRSRTCSFRSSSSWDLRRAGTAAEHLPELQKLGFRGRGFRQRHLHDQGSAVALDGADYRQLLLDILDELKVHGTSSRMDRLRDEILSVMACHPAIKVNRKLSTSARWKSCSRPVPCRMPHTCPHGRPTVVRFSMDEIKKMFKRHVDNMPYH